MTEELPEDLRAARLERGMTQSELARALKVCVDSVVHWERGHYAPRLSRQRQYARLLGLTVKQLRVLMGRGSELAAVLLLWWWS